MPPSLLERDHRHALGARPRPRDLRTSSCGLTQRGMIAGCGPSGGLGSDRRAWAPAAVGRTITSLEEPVSLDIAIPPGPPARSRLPDLVRSRAASAGKLYPDWTNRVNTLIAQPRPAFVRILASCRSRPPHTVGGSFR